MPILAFTEVMANQSHYDGFGQDYCNSIVNAMELSQSSMTIRANLLLKRTEWVIRRYNPDACAMHFDSGFQHSHHQLAVGWSDLMPRSPVTGDHGCDGRQDQQNQRTGFANKHARPHTNDTDIKYRNKKNVFKSTHLCLSNTLLIFITCIMQSTLINR